MRHTSSRIALSLLCVLAAGPGEAQQAAPEPRRQNPAPPRTPAAPPGGLLSPLLAPPPIIAPPQARSPQAPSPPREAGTSVRLSALYHEGSAAIARGVQWRVFAETMDGAGGLRLVAESSEAQPVLRLPPGSYMVTAAYGRASLARRMTIGSVPISDNFVLNAGGLRLAGSIGERALPESRVTYTVHAGSGPGGPVVADGVRGGRIVRLPVGDYHVVSRYGDANAIMSGDTRVQPGRLTEVTLHHRAAQITLKLVSERRGEAIANTAWSVLTPGGDTVQESIGAFPSMVLAAGDYIAIARNDGRVYNARFTVEPGQDREVEVLAR